MDGREHWEKVYGTRKPTEDELHAQFGTDFPLLERVGEAHRTLSGAAQAFVYCLCRVVAGAAG